jgi:hypothetical protein
VEANIICVLVKANNVLKHSRLSSLAYFNTNLTFTWYTPHSQINLNELELHLCGRNATINKKFWEELIAYFPLIWQGQHRKRRVLQFSNIACIRCRGIVFTEPLPSNDSGDPHTNTHWREGFMKCTLEMGSGAMACIPSFIKIGSSIQKLMEVGIHKHTDSKVTS